MPPVFAPSPLPPPSSSIARLLDTDILIDIQRGHSPALAWLATLNTATVAVAGYATMEILQNARNKPEAAASARLLTLFRRIWPSAAACDAAHTDFQGLHLSHNLGILDALIAATAREQGATLCTFNVKHFRAVPGLTTEQPYSR